LDVLLNQPRSGGNMVARGKRAARRPGSWLDRIPRPEGALFEKSGHYPMLEEHALFDQKLTQWIRKKK
jgi:pimeloyl-ACP methyl ester carboxylesterase